MDVPRRVILNMVQEALIRKKYAINVIESVDNA
jgi:hypothetical protein